MVVVYSKPSCVQCTATKLDLDKHGIQYQEVDLTQDPDMMEMFKAEGLFSAPIVVAGEQRWSGFRPDLIGAHASGRIDTAATAA